MSTFHTVVDVQGDASLLKQLRSVVFESVIDGGKRRPLFDPRVLIGPPAHVARWLDSYYDDRLAAMALHTGLAPEGFSNPGEFARSRCSDLGRVRAMVNDLRDHGPDFCQQWLDMHWGGHIDPSSTTIEVCRAMHLVFSFQSFGRYPPEMLMMALKSTYPTLAIQWHDQSSEPQLKGVLPR